LAGALYLILSAYVADKFSTPERVPVTRSPAQYGLSYQPVSFYSTVDHIRLEGWYIDSPGSKVIVMLHGWNGNRDNGDTAMPVTQALVAHNYDVFMFDFQGHGESGDGRMSLGQFETRDVAGALDYLRTRDVTGVGVLGWSLGANTAVNSAPEHPEMRAIVADSVWAELSPVFENQLTKYSGLPTFFSPGVMLAGRALYGIDIPNNRPARALASLGSRPVLLIHGSKDDRIPVANAYALQKAAANDPNFELWIALGAGHTRAFHDHPEEFLKRVLAIYDKYLQ
jgi:pimeloyl-ACP methyl ester carboxylesterase